jgi:hypothetical protein
LYTNKLNSVDDTGTEISWTDEPPIMILDWIVVRQVCVLKQLMMKALDKQLGVKASSCHRPGVKGKASTRLLKG